MSTVLGARPRFGRLDDELVDDPEAAASCGRWSVSALRAATEERPARVWAYRHGECWPSHTVDTTTHAYLDYVAAAPGSAEAEARRHEADLLYGFLPMSEVVERHRYLGRIAAAIGCPWDPTTTGARLYASRLGTTSGLHWDGAGTTLIQFVGEKQGVVFAPSASRALDPFPGSTGPNSGIDPFDPAGTLPPSIGFTLGPGDYVSIPRGWWHCLRATSPISVSVNLWDT